MPTTGSGVLLLEVLVYGDAFSHMHCRCERIVIVPFGATKYENVRYHRQYRMSLSNRDHKRADPEPIARIIGVYKRPRLWQLLLLRRPEQI